MKKYPFVSLTISVGNPIYFEYYAQINRVGKTRTFYGGTPEILKQRLLRCLAGEPAFGPQKIWIEIATGVSGVCPYCGGTEANDDHSQFCPRRYAIRKHPIGNYPNSTAWYLDNFDR